MNKSNEDTAENVARFIDDNVDSDMEDRADKLHKMLEHLTMEQRIQVIEGSIIKHKDSLPPMQVYKMKKWAKKMRRLLRVEKNASKRKVKTRRRW